MLNLVIAVWMLTGCGRCVCETGPGGPADEDERNAVFVGEVEASSFLGRHLLYNRFDFEAFTPGNLERECREEVCNYEEAREVFENYPDTDAFWKEYTSAQNPGPKVDVTALLVGIIAGSVAVIILGIVIWYSCERRCKNKRLTGSIRSQSGRSNASVIIRRLEEVSLHPMPPPLPDMDTHGLPSYEQAITAAGPHDVPPPPYPGSRQGTLRI